MKLATWNVNSLKVRLPQVLDWLASNPVDALCLQETKMTDDAFPLGDIEAAGYHCLHTGQKTYNGVAILSRQPMSLIAASLPDFDDPQKRFLAATMDTPAGPVAVVCGYFPNGQAVGSDKYAYKLAWLDALQNWLAGQLESTPQLALLGDFNIAPEDRDVHDPAAWSGKILCSDEERERFTRLTALGLGDAFRLFEQPDHAFSWWDYRMGGFRRNLGLRIDHILLSAPLLAHCDACWIDVAPRRNERPSDHTPVVASLLGPASGEPS